MNALRSLGLVSIFGASFTLVACEGSGSATLENRSPEERIAAVEDALASPSGDVDASSAKIVLQGSLSLGGLDALDTFLDGVPGLSDGSDGSCSTGSSSDGSVDVSCSSDGQASGKASYSVHSSATRQLVEITLDQLCDDSRCLDGSLVVSVETTLSGEVSTIVQGSLDITEDGKTSHGEWGTSTQVSQSGVSVDTVVFDEDGDSYTVSTSVSGIDAAGKVTITGANGEFSCEYDAGGASGSCSGSGSFSW